MGKGARVREERQREAVGAENVTSLLSALDEVDGYEDLAVLVEKRPELFAAEVLSHIESVSEIVAAATYLEPMKQLVRLAGEDPERAWKSYRAALAEVEESLQSLQPESEALTAMLSEERYDEAVLSGEELLSKAIEAGLGLVVAQTHEQLLDAYRGASGDKGENIDRAIDHAQGAVAAIPEPHRAGAMMNMAVLINLRVKGDPAENFEQAVMILRDALAEAERAGDQTVLATVEMNLARTLQVRQRGEKLANLLEARELCLSSLKYRSLKRDSTDWAHSKVNMGGIYNDLVGLGAAAPEDARAEFEELIGASEHVEEKWLVGVAHSSLGAVHRDEAGRIQKANDRINVGPGRPDPPVGREAEELEAARTNFLRALEILDRDANRAYVGRTLADLAAVADDFEDEEEAVRWYRLAVDHVDSRLEPAVTTRAAGRLGTLLAQQGEWKDAAAAFVVAVEAADLAFHARLDTSDRISEIQRSGNLTRWASFAIARAGDIEKAALTLENGLTRELRRRLGVGVEEDQLSQLPAEARSDYEAARAELSATPAGGEPHAARVFQQVVSAIRNLPGHEDFATGAKVADIAGAVESDWPVVYVNPTPFGTLLLGVFLIDGKFELDAVFLEEPTSFEVFIAMLLGNHAGSFPSSYLAAITNPDPADGDLDRALDFLTKALGDGLGRSLAGFMEDHDAMGATLIPCGPVSLAPVHALSWDREDEETLLLDRFVLREAPSATLQRTSLEMAQDKADAPATLAALGNPDLGNPELNLPAAEAEVEEIADLFPEGTSSCAYREAANRSFLRSEAPAVSYLHLACHGSGAIFSTEGEEEARIFLAGGEVSDAELSMLGLGAKLVVASACETAMTSISYLPQEAFSLGVAFLSAGSVAAVATLWSVDDLATAILMTRFYEEMLEQEASPAHALRTAQLWLRSLDESAEADFLSAHPKLEQAFKRRSQDGERPGRRKAASMGGAPVVGHRPYESPEFWAPFVCFGAG